MAGGTAQAMGPGPRRYDAATFAGIGAAQRIAFAGDVDEGDRRMRELIEKMRAIEARPIARGKPGPSRAG